MTNTHPTTSTLRRGFTLIELLVVIAIIAVLAAILFPVFTKAQEKALQTTCTSNQRQLAVLLMMSVQDNDDAFPGNDRLSSIIRSNVKVSRCPAGPQSCGYVWNYRIANKSTAGASLLNGSKSDPTNVFLTADGLPSEVSAPKNRIYVDQFDLRHQNKLMASFLDGHVAIANRRTANAWLPEQSFTGTLKIYGSITGLQDVINAYKVEYQAEYGRPINFTIDSAGNNMVKVNKIRTNKDGDLFIPADTSYINLLNHEGLCQSNGWHLQPQAVRLVVKSTIDVQNLPDLIHKVDAGQIKLGMGDPASGYVALLLKKYVENEKINWATFTTKPNVTTFTTIGLVQTALTNGTVDAGLLWEKSALTVCTSGNLKIVPDESLDKELSYIACAALTVNDHQFEAMQFARYLGAKDKGLPILKSKGVDIVPVAEMWGGFD